MFILGHFYYHERMKSYDFGPKHPLKPMRLDRTMVLLKEMVPEVQLRDPGLAKESDITQVHSEDFVHVVQELSGGHSLARETMFTYGFGGIDTPPFRGMYEASLAYCGGAVRAAQAVNQGARLAFNIAGGLHHARRSMASGFCIFDDPAISVSILRQKFDRVGYIDIDLHHGDGVQWIFYEDPTVLTYSIHESGHSLYPGCGFVKETGEGYTSVNAPLIAGTTGDVWLTTFRETVIPAIERFNPEAIVLQMGCDAHFDDPLGHLYISTQDFFAAVAIVRDFGLPIVACGGGGYNMINVPRMWVGAILTLAGIEFSGKIPGSIPPDWGIGSFYDDVLPSPQGVGAEEAAEVVRLVRQNIDRIKV
ncbi:MAG: acetoin utilization protein AcuC [Fimbriimonadaceae bacterium]|jgi:acetoin utilization protein AcuC|nr:acetoin utilization protein AcuC [Fimbriimonadaceae bacterium]